MDAIQTDLNLSSLSVSSPSVSSCSATLPFPVYYCKNSDLISVFARYVDPKWILFWLFWLAWRRQKKLKLLLFFALFVGNYWVVYKIIRTTLGYWMNGPKLQFAACPKHCHGGQKHHHHHWMDTLLLTPAAFTNKNVFCDVTALKRDSRQKTGFDARSSHSDRKARIYFLRER